MSLAEPPRWGLIMVVTCIALWMGIGGVVAFFMGKVGWGAWGMLGGILLFCLAIRMFHVKPSSQEARHEQD